VMDHERKLTLFEPSIFWLIEYVKKIMKFCLQGDEWLD
jgi:hypothetical protein